jgi:glutathione synthase
LLLQSTLWNAHGIKTVRHTLADVAAMGKLDADGTLRIGDELVSVVYFRAGCVPLRCATASSCLRNYVVFSYTPTDYPTETEWEGRSLIERSAAAKCPSIGCARVTCSGLVRCTHTRAVAAGI